MRLDKFLVEMRAGSRSQVKEYLKKGIVTVNGVAVQKPDTKIDELSDTVFFQGKRLLYEKYVYYMLNKPAGVVSATRDNYDVTVIDLIKKEGRDDLFPVGRLDKDTEGLLLLTNDGELAHSLLSPARHVEKTYFARLSVMPGPGGLARIEKGLDIGEEKMTLPARCEILNMEGEPEVLLTITEGKFHQVKRMFEAVGSRVLYLKRIRMGGLLLDESLDPGEYRRLTSEETDCLLGVEKHVR